MSERQMAVALRYEEKHDQAPRVIAKGHGTVAESILRLAKEHRIPVRADVDLARVLVQLDLNALIPEHLYPAVAEVLAYVYRMNGQAGQKGS